METIMATTRCGCEFCNGLARIKTMFMDAAEACIDDAGPTGRVVSVHAHRNAARLRARALPRLQRDKAGDPEPSRIVPLARAAAMGLRARMPRAAAALSAERGIGGTGCPSLAPGMPA
jgi:hypothetical protein